MTTTKPGTKKKPAAIHRQQGTHRDDRHLPDALENYVKPVTEIPEPPASLTEQAKRYWFLITRELVNGGIFSDGDMMMVEVLAAKHDLHKQAIEAVNSEGLVSIVTNSKGTTYPMPNPHINIARTLSKEIMELSSHLGLSPLARTQIGVSKSSNDDAFKDDL